MKKKKSNKQQDEKLQKIHAEIEFIHKEISSVYKSAEGIGVDTEHREVSFMVDNHEFSNHKKDFKTDNTVFKYESCDNSMMSLRFTYTKTIK